MNELKKSNKKKYEILSHYLNDDYDDYVYLVRFKLDRVWNTHTHIHRYEENFFLSVCE